MAETKFIKAKKPVTVPLSDGQHASLQMGQPIAKDALAAYFLDRIGSDPYLDDLVEPASQKDVDDWNEGIVPEPPKDFDRQRLSSMEGVVLPAPDQVAEIVDGDTMIKDREQVERVGHTQTTPERNADGSFVDPEAAATHGSALTPAERKAAAKNKKDEE